MQGRSLKDSFSSALRGKPEEAPETPPPADTHEEPPPILDVGKCASVARGRWVTALTIKAADGSATSYQYRDMGTVSKFTPTEFTIVFEGRKERHTLVVAGRCLGNIYDTCIQHRLEWIQPADRDFGDDGVPFVSSAKVTTEKVD